MNKVERQMQFLDLYRKQLQRETEAMGYGRETTLEANNRPSEIARPASRQTIFAVLATLGLVKKQIQLSS